MILSAHQPAYLPWLGYFDKIKRSDLFVYMDDVQFEKNSFINRNKIKSANGPVWLTIAVKHKGHLGSSMLDLQVDQTCQWQKKHLGSISMNYAKAKYYAELYPKLEKLYQTSHESLVELCWEHLNFWLTHLKIKTKIVRLSELKVEGKKADLILNLCKHFNANYYISGILGKDYLVESEFSKHNIEIEYQHFTTPHYPQLYGDFLANLSIIDYCMNNEAL